MSQIPGFRAPVAEGHAGTAYLVDDTLLLAGRTHLYEGHGPAPVVHGVRAAAAWGARTCVLTNANGSLRPDWEPGRPVLVRDHLNLTGASPLEGATFVDLTDAWSPRLREVARRADATLAEGVYCQLPGPHYNTAAEAEWMRRVGGDLVGMSTVLEAIAAREAGMELLGVSVVSAVEGSDDPIDPAEVVEVVEATAVATVPVLRAVLDAVR